MTNEEKIEQINSRLTMLDFVIENITQGIAENPDADIEGKRPRAEVLNDLVLEKQALISFKETL
jgi:hypothetical protein